MQQKEKVRLYTLARELDIDTKILLQYCKELGFDVKNQLSSLDPEQSEQLKQRVERGNRPPTTPPGQTPRANIPTTGLPGSKIRNLNQPKRAGREADQATPVQPNEEDVAPSDSHFPHAPAAAEPAGLPPIAEAPVPPATASKPIVSTQHAPVKPVEPTVKTPAAELKPPAPLARPTEPPPQPRPPATNDGNRAPMRDLGAVGRGRAAPKSRLGARLPSLVAGGRG